ncbi:hypothetical protein O983_07440 [Mycobacterium avium 09-5983]|nr:hypothetical protein O983_07440 [Mycobacterium avium 09-5983]
MAAHNRKTPVPIANRQAGAKDPADRNGVLVPGRVEIDNVQPVVSCGTYPAKAVVGEVVPVSASVWREGHEAVAATLVVRYLGPAIRR